MTEPDPALAFTLYQGRAGDRNPRGVAGAALLGACFARRLGAAPTVVGVPAAPLGEGWQAELGAARDDLAALAAWYDAALGRGEAPLTVMGRCATGLATLPAVAEHRPEAAVVWFDAHGDANTPASSGTGYLGGMVISAACGLWQSGLGAGLTLGQVVLVGARDLDPVEQALIDSGQLALVPAGPNLVERLADAVAGRPVYIHLDCDVLEPGTVPTEYAVPGGLPLDDLRAAFAMLAAGPLVGLEIAEFEAIWPDNRTADPEPLADAVMPLIRALGGGQGR